MSSLFEQLYQRFMQRGGFYQPALDEDVDRAWRKQCDTRPAKACPHGKTYLTCSECYFSDRKFDRGDSV